MLALSGDSDMMLGICKARLSTIFFLTSGVAVAVRAITGTLEGMRALMLASLANVSLKASVCVEE